MVRVGARLAAPDSLRSRIAPPDDTVLKAYVDSGVNPTLAIVVKDARGKVVYRYEPLASPLVRRRFAAVKDLLARKPGQRSGRDPRRASRCVESARPAVPQIAPCTSHLERRRLECGATRDILIESGVRRRRQ
jgi:hypothetical protein